MALKINYLSILLLIALFIFTSAFIFGFPYNVKERTFGSQSIWDAGQIPDEHAYIGWAQIYYETGKIYIPLEDIGRTKIQYVDFFLGDSYENCVFASAVVSQGYQKTPEWSSKISNITINVYDGNNNGIKGLKAEIFNLKRGFHLSGITNSDGIFNAIDVPPGFYTVIVRIANHPLKLFFVTDYSNVIYPIEISASLYSISQSSYDVLIHVDHYINHNLGGVKIYTGYNWEDQEPVGVTDENGDYILSLSPKSGNNHVVVVKETLNVFPPVLSGVVKVDDSYSIANHWPPGYCYLIIPFWISHLFSFITIFTFAIACISIYFLTKRLYDRKTAVLATIIIMVSGLTIYNLFNRGLADFAAMAFALLGITLYVESLQEANRRRTMLFRVLLGLFGGLCFMYAVTMRYSSIVIIIGPLVYVILLIFSKNQNEKISLSKRFISNFYRFSKKSLPFIIGLLIVGFAIAFYNTQLFGSPLSSGYQTDVHIEMIGDNTTIETANETMFEEFFNPSAESFHNLINRIVPQLFLLLPTLFLAPLGLFLDFRSKRSWLLFFWIIPVLVIYMQLTWVGTMTYQDMRYFLPVLPPTAIHTAYALRKTVFEWNRWILVGTLVVVGFLGFFMGYHAIVWQSKGFLRHFSSDIALIGYVLTSIIYVFIYGVILLKYFYLNKSR